MHPHTTAEHWLENQRTARTSSKGLRNLANVTRGRAPTLRTACIYAEKSRQLATGSGACLSKRKTRMIRVFKSRSRAQMRSRCGPRAKYHQLSDSLTPYCMWFCTSAEMAHCITVRSMLIILLLFHASWLRCQSLLCPRIRHDSESIPCEAEHALQGPLHDIIPCRSINLQQPLTIAKVVAQFRDAIRYSNVLAVNQQHALPPMGAMCYNRMQCTVVWRTPRKHDPVTILEVLRAQFFRLIEGGKRCILAY